MHQWQPLPYSRKGRNALEILDTAIVDSEDVLDPSLRGKVAITRLRNSSPDPKAWESLTGAKKESTPPVVPKPFVPPPPRAVVDVFRGDKHVQEVFRD